MSTLDAAAAAELLGVLRGAARQHADPVQVISAFQVPRVKYDPIRRTFYLAPDRPPLLGGAQARRLPSNLFSPSQQAKHFQSCSEASKPNFWHLAGISVQLLGMCRQCAVDLAALSH